MKQERLLSTGEVAEIFGVSYTAVKKWTYSGKIKYFKTPGGRYRYSESEVRRLLGLAPRRKVIVYARVSSSDQRDDLERQKNRLVEFARSQGYRDILVIEDIASGLNERRRGLRKLFDLVANGEVESVLITYKDRLTRFGFSYIERFFSSHGVSIHVIDGEGSHMKSLWKI